jgi:P22_AR N-terminal domain
MKIVDQYPFQFADSVFEIYWTDERILILPLRQLCEALGLDFSNQLQRVKRDVVLAKHLHMVRATVTRSDGVSSEQEVACIAYRRLDYWMGTIDHMRVKAGQRDRLILFKEEMADAIHAYFRSRRLPEDMLAELDAALPPEEQKYNKLMDQAATWHIKVEEHGTRIGGLEDRMIKLEARLMGTDFISHAQAQQYLDAVGALGDLMKETKVKKASPYAVIHNEVKRQFGVPSYQLIPENEFSQVLEFLAKWWEREAPGRAVPEIFRVRQVRLL